MEWVRQLSLALQVKGHVSDIVCIDDPKAPWLKDSPVKVVALGNKFGYRYSAQLVPWLKDHAKHYDYVIVHGLWRYVSIGTWLALRHSNVPYFIYTHGMLDPWFKRTYRLKHIFKWLIWPWTDYRALRDARAVLFTCDEERLLARHTFRLYKCNEAITTLGISAPTGNRDGQVRIFLDQFPHLRGRRLILFLSRIHPKKGCDTLVQAFAKIAQQDQALHLVMAGPANENLLCSLKSDVTELGLDNRITWAGMLTGDVKWGAYRASEVFVLPSHQENFGIVVAEALACGTPVLISNKVNIWREIHADKAGLVESDSLEGTTSLLKRWLELTESSRSMMRQRAIKSFQDRFEIEGAAAGFIGTLHKFGSR
jgi:glycosyltransferase involved in cell wall biosynthesis